MTIESAKAYMKRMRDDAEFKKSVSDRESDEATWEYVRSQGYDFTVKEFKDAQDELSKEMGFLIGKE